MGNEILQYLNRRSIGIKKRGKNRDLDFLGKFVDTVLEIRKDLPPEGFQNRKCRDFIGICTCNLCRIEYHLQFHGRLKNQEKRNALLNFPGMRFFYFFRYFIPTESKKSDGELKEAINFVEKFRPILSEFYFKELPCKRRSDNFYGLVVITLGASYSYCDYQTFPSVLEKRKRDAL